jgi:heat-inducible transcriptional repressor
VLFSDHRAVVVYREATVAQEERELDERKARVLRAVVHDFIKTAEPVGSRNLTERYALGVSPATIRHELAALEEQGFLTHPHTSAGRVPTDRGYRYYVDSLSDVGRLARAQEAAIASYFDGVADLEETLVRTSLLLASLTRHTAMVAPPALDRSRVRHVELVALGTRIVLLVLIFETGRISKRMIELADDVDPDHLEQLRRELNEALDGERLAEAPAALAALAERTEPTRRPLLDTVNAAIDQLDSDQEGGRVLVGGQAYLLASPGAFAGLETVQEVYEALEQQVILVRLLRAAMDADAESISVTIGTEHEVQQMQATSLVSTSYPMGEAVGSIGVLGPTRMDYLHAMAAVRAVARYLGDMLDDVEP